jgi:glycerophosphoryl diester phosphodiesterase
MLALFGLALAWSGAASPHADGRPPAVAAHRGGAALWPENSLLAFRSAAALGAEYLELDVHQTRDRELVVIHDPTLERTTTGAGAVKDVRLADLTTVRLKDARGTVTAEPVPRLDEVVALAAMRGRRLLVEIKVDAARARYPDIEERVLAALDRHRMSADAVVMAFEEETWRRVRALRPDVRAGALYSPRRMPPGILLGEALRHAHDAGVAFVGLDQSLVTADTVAQARGLGLVLGVWTVNDPGVMRRMIDAPVDVLITDRPDVAKQLLTDRRLP